MVLFNPYCWVSWALASSFGVTLVRSIDHETGCDIDCGDLVDAGGCNLSYIEAEATHHVPTKLVLFLLMLGAGIVWLVVGDQPDAE